MPFWKSNSALKSPFSGPAPCPFEILAGTLQENAIFPGSLCPSYGQTSRLHDRYETKHAWYPEIKNLHLSRWGTESVCRIQKRMLHPVSCHSCIRRWKNNMVSQSLQKHGSDIVYLQKTKPCIRKHLITKADRSLVDCLCECADNILRGNVPSR